MSVACRHAVLQLVEEPDLRAVAAEILAREAQQPPYNSLECLDDRYVSRAYVPRVLKRLPPRQWTTCLQHIGRLTAVVDVRRTLRWRGARRILQFRCRTSSDPRRRRCGLGA